MKKIIVLITLYLCCVNIVSAQPGQLDSSFGTNGLVPFHEPYYRVSSIAVQNDGKIILSGDWELSRYNPDGSVDSIFNNNLRPSDLIRIQSVSLQTDGKIIAMARNNIERINTDGSRDITFGDNGTQTTEGTSNSAVAIQSDGKIVIKGIEYDSHSIPYVILTRYNANGSLDNTFNGNGKVVSVITGSQDFSPDINSLAIQSDGKIVIAGAFVSNIYYYNFGIARYNGNGTVDKTFGNDGIKVIEDYNAATTLAIQADQKIVVAGHKYINADQEESSDICIARLNSNGTLDNSFSSDGKRTIDFGFNRIDFTNTVAIQDDGKILLGGSTFTGFGESLCALMRLNPDGNPDSTFNGKGIKLTEGFGGGGRQSINDLAIYLNKVYAVYKAMDENGFPSGSGVGGIARYLLGGVSVSITSPADNSAFNSPGPLNITAAATNPDGSITKVDFYNGTTLLGTDYTSPYSYSWSNKLTGDHADYFLTAKATDNNGKVTTSPVVHVFEVKSQAPVVSFISPSNNAAYAAPATITLEAEARDTQTFGGISKVEFFNGQTLLSTATRSPYIFSWDNVPAGNYLLTAKATDNTGLTATDKINVSVSINTPPTVSITSPSDNARLGGPVTITFIANATDDNRVTEVEFFNGSTLLGTAYPRYRYPTTYYFTWRHVPLGEYTITAKATDNGGLTTTSDPVHITVVKNQPPTVSLAIPNNVVKYASPARIKLNAAATDHDGKITKVQFYNGTTLLHTEDIAPYGFLWTGVPAGNYTLTAKAFDNGGSVITSNSINVSVVNENVPPVVSIVNPVDDTTYTGPATIRLIANAKDLNDKISKVVFYNGSALLRTEHYYPYTYTWTNVQPGTYTITAVAYDDIGLSATSAPVTITVNASSLPIVKSRPYVNNQSDVNGVLSMKLSPVPTGSTLQIYTKGLQLNKPSTISVISASGVLMKTIQSNTSNKVVQMDVSSLVSGVYTVKVISGGKVTYKQFVKL